MSRVYGARSFRNNWFTLRWDLPDDLERYRRLDPSRRAAIVLFCGHAPLVTGEAEIDALTTVTFLRDPVERFKSYCQHVSEGRVPTLYSAEGFDLDRFIDFYAGSHNQQTRFLLGVGNFDLPEGSPAQLAARALAVLETRLAAYGLSEHFEESLLLFRRTLGWKTWPVYTSLNRKNTRQLLTFSERQTERIRALNEIDTLVYEKARTRFLERIDRESDRVRAEMRRFHLRQAFYSPFLTIYQVEHALRVALQKRRARQGAPDGR